MGYSCSPKIWTKVLKSVFAHLRALGHVSVYFIDDSCLNGDSYDTCLKNVLDTVKLMGSWGLTINESKSVLIPRKKASIFRVHFMLRDNDSTINRGKK